MGNGVFRDRTVLIAAAGTDLGREICLGFAQEGATVIAVDHDEDAVLDLACMFPDNLDALRLNLLIPEHVRHFTDIWADEPLAYLVLCQLVRFPDRPAMALRSCGHVATALAPALRAGRGQAIYVCENRSADVVGACLSRAASALADLLQTRLGVAVPINGLQLPGDAQAACPPGLHAAMTGLNAPGSARIGGALLTLLPRSD